MSTPLSRTRVRVLIVSLFVSLLSACGLGRNPTGCQEAPELVVSAAISLKEALTAYQATFEARECVKLRFNFGASGQLMRQIEQGAPVDVFLSAGPQQVEELAQKGLIDAATRVNVVKNTLVLVVKKGALKEQPLTFERLKSEKTARLAIGEPKSVPAGMYARDVLERLGVYDEMKQTGRLIFGGNVRQVLAYVETGEVDGGIVYKTDAFLSHRVAIADEADPSWHRPIVYTGAVIQGSKHPDKARAFLVALTREEGRAVLERYGFVPAAK